MSRASKQLAFHTSQTLNHSTAKRLPVIMRFLLSFVLLVMAINSYALEVMIHPVYGSPYTSDDYYPPGNCSNGHQISGSPGESISDWWIGWRRCWPGYPQCSYSVSQNAAWPFSNYWGGTSLTGGCGGGHRVYGTAKCPLGYLLSGAVCVPNGAPKIDKNLGVTGCDVGKTIVGNPIDPGIGNKIALEVDYQGTGVFPLNMKRTYNSSASLSAGRLGSNWVHAYEIAVRATNTSAIVQRLNGKLLVYALINGVWTADSDVTDVLTQQKNASGTTIGWKIVSADNQVESYNANGKLLLLTTPMGASQTLTYDTNNLLSKVSDPEGRSLTFTYDRNALIQTMSDPAGNIYRYGYDGNGNLKTVIYPDNTPTDSSDNPKKTYVYGSDAEELVNTANVSQPNALTGIIDENGVRYATYRYDSVGKAISTEHVGGVEKYSLDYAPDGSKTAITDPLGVIRITHFTTVLGVVKATGSDQPGGVGCSAASSAMTYDANGNIASRTDFNGNLSCYAYDLSRNLETVHIEGRAAGSSCPTNPAAYTPAANSNERKISTQWHANYRLPTQIDRAGQRLNLSYDTFGNLLTKTITDTASQQSRSWNYTYNNLGQILTADGPRTDVNDITTYNYYADSSAAHKPGDLWTITNALGHITSFTAYDVNGRLLSLNDPNGLTVSLNYDARGRLTQKTVDGHTTRYDYNNVGNLIKFTKSSGVFFTYTYDAAHRLTYISDALGGKIHYTLDAMGNRVQEDIQDAQGTVMKTQSRVYDALNRLAKDIGAYNQTTSYQYDASGNLTKTIDPAGNTTQHQYDTLDHLIRTTDALNGQTDYVYDSLDRVVQVIDANNHSTLYSYNGLGDLIQLDSPNTGVSQYSYDSVGNLAHKTDADGVTSTYQYDELNRLLSIDYPGSEADLANGYDGTAQNPTGQLGHLTSARRGDIETRQQFDLRGNLTQSTVTDVANNRTVSEVRYTPNADDQLIAIQPSANRRIENHYDTAGQVNRVQLLDTDTHSTTTTRVLADNIQHLPFGPVKSLDYGNGLLASRQYDQHYRLVSGTAGTVFHQEREYDRVGNISSQADNYGESKHEYDGLGQLDVADADIPGLNWQRLGFQNDAVGNRLVNWRDYIRTDYQYDPDSQRLLSKTVNGQMTSYGYNSQGQTNQVGNRTLNYAPDQRLTGIVQGNSTLGNYRYDAFGHRIGKTVATGSTDYVYDQDHRLIAETKGTGIQHTVYLDGQPLARIDGESSNSPIRYFHTNHLGAPLVVSDQKQQIVWRGLLELFGQVTPINPNLEQNLRFAGQYFDAETGWHYNYQRYYDPNLGRYLQSDPIGLAGGVNAYVYVGNNPLNYIDPLGLTELAPGQNPLIGGGITGMGTGGSSLGGSGLSSGARFCPTAVKGINTPFGIANQGVDAVSLAARGQVENGATLYRIGTTGKSQAAEAQFWSLENPLSKEYAQRYGIPAENVKNANFIQTATLKSGTSFVTRPAPGVGANTGGGIEVVVPESGVMMRAFNYGDQ